MNDVQRSTIKSKKKKKKKKKEKKKMILIALEGVFTLGTTRTVKSNIFKFCFHTSRY